MMKAKNKKWKYTLISICSVSFVVIVWYLCINVLHLKAETVFPGPLTVVKTFIQKLYTKAPDGATLPVDFKLKSGPFGIFSWGFVWGSSGNYDGMVEMGGSPCETSFRPDPSSSRTCMDPNVYTSFRNRNHF